MADIWHGRLSADKANVTARNLLVYNKIWRYWQICHFLWRTKKGYRVLYVPMYIFELIHCFLSILFYLCNRKTLGKVAGLSKKSLEKRAWFQEKSLEKRA